MSVLQSLQLRGRHVQQPRPLLLPLLFTLLWLPAQSESRGCHDAALNIRRAIGEQWLLPNCGGAAICRRSYIITYPCPETYGCRRLDEGDPSATFPRCCPRLDCPFCYSEQLDRYFGPSSRWTEGNCVEHRCKVGPSGSLERHENTCEPLGPPPSLDCEVVGQDMSRGEYPLCCAYYRCPGLCRSGDTWRPVKAVRGDSCDGAAPDSPASWLPWN